MPSADDRKWPVVVSDALYQRLLVLYPTAFRAEYGAEMAQVFRDRVRQAYRTRRAISVLALWPAALCDLVANAAGEQARRERHVSRTIVILAVVLVVAIVGEYLYHAAPDIYYSILSSIFGPISTVMELLVIQPIFNVLVVVDGFVHSFPLALVIVTLAFQLCLLPLTRRQLRAARAPGSLQPQLQQLREQYRSEPHAAPAAQLNLYRTHGIKLVSIVVWMLVQLPFLYALYGTLLTVLPRTPNYSPAILNNINKHLYSFAPHITALPSMHFLWINLAYPDPLHILPIVAAVLTFTVLHIAMKIRPRPAQGTAIQPDAMRQATSIMQYIVPFLTLLIGWTFASGLALYWIVSMAFAVALQVVLRGAAGGPDTPDAGGLIAGGAY